MRFHLRNLSYLALVLPAVTLAACSSSSPSASPTSTAAVSSGSVSAATAKVLAAGVVPTFVAPGPAFSVAGLKGDNVWVVPTNSTIPLVPIVETGFAQALATAGATTTNFTTTGNTSDWVTGMSQAIAHKASAIMLLGVDPNLLKPELASAQAAGIPVILDYTVPPTDNIPGLTSTVTLPFYQSARLMADQAISETNGKADILPVGTSSVLQNAGMLAAFRDEIAKNCPNCKVENTLNVQLPDWSTTLGSSVRTTLSANANINFVAPMYDAMEEFVLPAISQAGKSTSVKTDSFNGTPSVVSQISTSSSLIGDAGQSNSWIGWATADQTMRALSHTKLVTESIPIRYWTPANASQEPTVGYGTEYESGFKALWNA